MRLIRNQGQITVMRQVSSPAVKSVCKAQSRSMLLLGIQRHGTAVVKDWHFCSFSETETEGANG